MKNFAPPKRRQGVGKDIKWTLLVCSCCRSSAALLGVILVIRGLCNWAIFTFSDLPVLLFRALRGRNLEKVHERNLAAYPAVEAFPHANHLHAAGAHLSFDPHGV
jgi:hypothetical protein